MIRKADVLLTAGCVVALGLSAAGALRPGAPARVRIDTWFRARATRKILKRDWGALAAGPDRLGALGTDAEAVLFLDFECPYCATQWLTLDSVLIGHQHAAIAIRHHPLGFHGAAEGAARAAICAGREGKFSEMASELFTHQEWRADRNWMREARVAGVSDTTTFSACLQATATTRRLKEDSAFGSELGVVGTPTFVFQDRVVPGVLSRARLEQILSADTTPGR